MTINEIMEKIREGLTGEYSVDMVYLESQADKYRSAKNAKEIESAIADLAYEILPDDKRCLCRGKQTHPGKEDRRVLQAD